jgi:hypothetical protein
MTRLEESKQMLWTVIKEIKRDCTKNSNYLLCQCVCGVTKEVRKSSYGKTSFGCKKCKCAAKKHGMTNSPLHIRWQAMKQRCCNPNQIGAKLYFERGISVCKEWINDFRVFHEWAINNGFNESLSLDRIDNDKGYFPDNCRWVTSHAQNRNQRTNIWHEQDGKRMILKDWCEHLDINYDAVRNRIYSGKTIKEALSVKTVTSFKKNK